MWIRTQDRKRLLNCNELWVQGNKVYGDTIPFEDSLGYPLGAYDSEERAIEVLNCIENAIREGIRIRNESYIANVDREVYVMPEK